MSDSKRIEWIDVAKGVGIVLVSFGHLRNGDGESVWLPALDAPIDAIYLFHMPLFFLPWGGSRSVGRGEFKAFLVRKAKTLLVPYYVFSLYFLAKPFAILLIPSMSAAFQTSHDYGIAHQFLDVLVMGNGLWFLMAFFVGECLMYGLTSLTDDGRVLAAIGMAFVILSTFVSSQTGWPALPFQIVAGGQGSWLHVRRIRAEGMAQSHSARESGRIVSLRGRSVPDVGGTGRGRNRYRMVRRCWPHRSRRHSLARSPSSGCASWWGHARCWPISAATASSITR